MDCDLRARAIAAPVRPQLPSWLTGRVAALGVAALAGAALGASLANGVAIERASGAPAGWHSQESKAPYMNQATLGELGDSANQWSLSAYSSLRADAPAAAGSLTVELGVEGQLWLLPTGQGAREAEGSALALSTGKAPAGVELTAGRPPRALDCSGSLPPPGWGAYTVRWSTTVTGWRAEHGGATLSCASTSRDGTPVLSAGLHRVRLAELSVDGGPSAPPGSTALILVSAIGGALVLTAIVTLELAAGVTPVAVMLACLPLLLAPLGGLLNLDGLHEALRVPSLRVQLFPATMAALVALFGHAGAWAGWAAQRQVPRGAAAGASGLLGVLCVAAILSHGSAAWLPAALGASAGVGLGAAVMLRLVRRVDIDTLTASAGVLSFAAVAAAATAACGARPLLVLWSVLGGGALGLLVQLHLHARRVRLYNTLSLVAAVFGCVAAEMATRSSSVGPLWDATNPVQGAGDVATLATQLDALHAAQHTTYPSEGYPVAAPAKVGLRVVCLGGSSTAGAYQNADIREFYPTVLQTMVPGGVEVLNQAAGGWNSLHIALFATSSFDRLAPDVVTVYTGVNEVVPVPVPYKTLYASWQAGGLRAGWGALGSFRMFQGLRSVTRSLRPAVVAVPPEHTRENLTTILEAARSEGARVLFLSEAVQPRPEAFSAYWRVMADLAAAQPDVAYYDSAEALRPLGGSAFLDQNHLSATGHRRLAEVIAAELSRLGWMATHGAADESVPPL